MPRSVTPTIADHSTHRLFTAVHSRSLIECYNFSAMSQTVLQAPTETAAASAAACLAAKETASRCAWHLVAQVLRLRVTEKNVFVLGPRLVHACKRVSVP